MKSIDSLNVSILCGGQSSEHAISILSAQNVVGVLLGLGCAVEVVWIDQSGQWWRLISANIFVDTGVQAKEQLVLTPGGTSPWRTATTPSMVDVVFPLVHGETGEDGALQGLLDLLSLPYVGANVISSAIGMHKEMAKRVWRAAALPTCDWVTLSPTTRANYSYDSLASQWGDRLFVKPACQGSSVGVSCVTDAESFERALDLAFQYSDCVLVEPAIDGVEIECSVRGYGDELVASVPGELDVHHDFYSYDAKYNDKQGATAIVPARLNQQQQTAVQQLALAACRTLLVEGMARVDFFVNDERIVINEINTIPGFTEISLYPRNWQESGVSVRSLVQDLLISAIDHFEQRIKRYALISDTMKKD